VKKVRFQDPPVEEPQLFQEPQLHAAAAEVSSRDLEETPCKQLGSDQSEQSCSRQGSGEEPAELHGQSRTAGAHCWKPRNGKDWDMLQASAQEHSPILTLFVAELMQTEQKKTFNGRMAIVSGSLAGSKRELKVL